MEDLYPSWNDCITIPFKQQDQRGREEYVFSRMENPSLHTFVKNCNTFDLKTKEWYKPGFIHFFEDYYTIIPLNYSYSKN